MFVLCEEKLITLRAQYLESAKFGFNFTNFKMLFLAVVIDFVRASLLEQNLGKAQCYGFLWTISPC